VTPPERLLAAVRRGFAAAPGPGLGVAVSGGGDSVALLVLAKAWSEESGRPVAAITVDHGLRPEAAAEAEAVAALCARLGVPHDVRTWRDQEGPGNLQDRARAARRTLIAEWARARGLEAVALGHTRDDQAETFLMRLARGSGVDGLSGMAPAARWHGVLWLRPLLDVGRAELREWLAAEGIVWAEDPGNADPRFDRTRARAALAALGTLGLGAERLAATAAGMARARAALERATAELARACLSAGPGGDLALDPGPFRDAPDELRLRLLAGALGWVAGAVYRPRLAALEAALAAIDARALGLGLTLHGCVLRPRGRGVAIRREPARAAPRVPLAQRSWDGRWEFSGDAPAIERAEIGGLGVEGLARVPGWRASGIARETLLTTPAIWRGADLLAAPLARNEHRFNFRRISAIAPPWAAGDLSLNAGGPGLC
jgi:tRNA(Ile)-lysidine synthase